MLVIPEFRRLKQEDCRVGGHPGLHNEFQVNLEECEMQFHGWGWGGVGVGVRGGALMLIISVSRGGGRRISLSSRPA